MSMFFSKNKLAQDIESICATPTLTKMRITAGYTNLYRLVLTFSRLTVQETLLLLKNTQWIKFFNELLGLSLDTDQMIRILNTPVELFRFLSVALFAFRLSTNMGDMFWHYIFPTATRTADIVWQEQWNVILNDAVWTTANLFSNYATYFKIAPPIAAGITACFLCFDISLLLYRKELKKHDLTQATQAWFNANLLAASLLALGFSASFILTAPALVPLEFFVCALGTGLYATADGYADYIDKRVTSTQDAANEAWSDFTTSLFKNTVLPSLFMMTLALSLPAGVLFATLYIGYELKQRYIIESDPQLLCALK